jgi:hypothetical protein
MTGALRRSSALSGRGTSWWPRLGTERSSCGPICVQDASLRSQALLDRVEQTTEVLEEQLARAARSSRGSGGCSGDLIGGPAGGRDTLDAQEDPRVFPRGLRAAKARAGLKPVISVVRRQVNGRSGSTSPDRSSLPYAARASAVLRATGIRSMSIGNKVCHGRRSASRPPVSPTTMDQTSGPLSSDGTRYQVEPTQRAVAVASHGQPEPGAITHRNQGPYRNQGRTGTRAVPEPEPYRNQGRTEPGAATGTRAVPRRPGPYPNACSVDAKGVLRPGGRVGISRIPRHPVIQRSNHGKSRKRQFRSCWYSTLSWLLTARPRSLQGSSAPARRGNLRKKAARVCPGSSSSTLTPANLCNPGRVRVDPEWGAQVKIGSSPSSGTSRGYSVALTSERHCPSRAGSEGAQTVPSPTEKGDGKEIPQ